MYIYIVLWGLLECVFVCFGFASLFLFVLFMLHIVLLSSDEKDGGSSGVSKILGGTITVIIATVLLLALVSCIFCHSRYAHIIQNRD